MEYIWEPAVARSKVNELEDPEAVFLVMCDPPMNELWAT
jgi:hypothetical protein